MLCGDTPKQKKFAFRVEDKKQVVDDLTQEDLKSSCVCKVLSSNFTSVMEELKRTGTKFTDPEFPPVPASLGPRLSEKVTWRRLVDIYKNPVLFDSKIEPGDIVQGGIGDCFFLSTISSIAQQPKRIERLFGQFNIGLGIYELVFNIEGVPTTILVDDYVPVKNGLPAFANPVGTTQEIWSLVLQKGWAKIKGSYQQLQGGYPQQVLNCLTLGSAMYFNLQAESEQSLWQKISKFDKIGMPMVASTSEDKTIEKLGLLSFHTYSLISVGVARGKRIVQLRNSWGDNRWKGPLNKDDPFWATLSGDQKRAVGMTDLNHGFFFLEFSEFLKHFAALDVGIVIAGYNYNYDQFYLGTEPTLFSIDLVEEQDLFWMVYFTDIKDEQDPDPKGTISIFRLEEDGIVHVLSSSKTLLKSTKINAELVPGRYLVLIKIDSAIQAKKTMTFATYTKQHIRIQELNCSDFFRSNPDFWKTVSLQLGRESKTLVFRGKDCLIKSDFLVDEGDFGVVYAKNEEKNHQKLLVRVDLDALKKQNFEVIGNSSLSQGSGLVSLVVQPGKELAVLVRRKGRIEEEVCFPAPFFKFEETFH